jgi:hypothetical protein
VRTRAVAALLLIALVAVPVGCRRSDSSGSPRISPYREVQRYTLEGPITPIGQPIRGEQIRIDLSLIEASRAEGELQLFRDDVWIPFGAVEGGWDGQTMTLTSEDGGGNAMRFELLFGQRSVRGTALVLFVRRGATVRYGVDLAYR